MLPSSISKQLFGNMHRTHRKSKRQQLLTELARLHLDLHQIPWEAALSEPSTDGSSLLDVESALKLCKFPDLKGTLDSHFREISLQLSACWINRAKAMSSTPLPPLPNFDAIGGLPSGWTCYDPKTDMCTKITHPPHSEDLYFDIETCPRISKHAIMAVAASCNAWYFWKSPLFESPSQSVASDYLIPLGRDRLVIGHNISFDRARVFEEYCLDLSSNLYYLDTMALHCAVSGLSNQQRTLWLKYRKMLKEIQKRPDQPSNSPANIQDDNFDNLFQEDLSDTSEIPDSFTDIDQYSKSSLGRWLHHSSPNSLSEASSLHCNIPVPSKEDRNFFLNCTSLSEIDENWNQLLEYCANDVFLTHKLFRSVWPKFFSYNPHPATFSSLLAMGKMILPSDTGWFSWITGCESLLNSFSNKLKDSLNNLAIDLIQSFCCNDKWKDDPWLRHLDWTPVPEKYCLLPKTKKTAKKKTKSHEQDQVPMVDDMEDTPRQYDYTKPVGNPLFFGKPIWYKKLWDPTTKSVLISPKMTIVPYLLGITWDDKPVHHLGIGKGWSYLNPDQSHSPIPYPKPDSESSDMSNVGSIISKAFFPFFLNKKLKATRSPELAELAFEACTEFSFWTSYRSRVSDALAIDLRMQTPPDVTDHSPLAILPQICPMGTITRRATDRLWMTSTASSKSSVLGSDLKSRIVAPSGWKFVGADVDAQELWISSIFGDAQFGEHGSTALSWMGLAGSKTDGTDLHSKTASLLGNGATRDLAKVFNYARFYGSGIKFASSLLHSTQPNTSKAECDEIATKLYRQTKGEVLSTSSSKNGHLLVGGSESYMFNSLASLSLGRKYDLANIASEGEVRPASIENALNDIRTPVLKSRITDALSPWNIGEGSQFATSRMNWVVQSSAVDYLHLLLTGMLWLCNRHQITARLAITIHDEVRWLVKEEHAIRAAIALQISNLWTRAAFSQAMEMPDLPLAVAFFSTVEIDDYLRKDPKSPCLSPLRKDPLPPGLSYSFTDLIRERRKELNTTFKDGPLSESELLGPAIESPTTDDNHLHHLTHLLNLNGTSKFFMPKPASQRISIIMQQEKFKSHPDYASKIAPHLEKKTSMKKLLDVDEFGDPVRKKAT